MITENLSTLKIHKLTQAQYDRELEAGNLDETALYLTPDEEVEIPTTLPNPNKLTFTGAVNAEYDGSEAVSVEIPGDYQLADFVVTVDANNMADKTGAEVYEALRQGRRVYLVDFYSFRYEYAHTGYDYFEFYRYDSDNLYGAQLPDWNQQVYFYENPLGQGEVNNIFVGDESTPINDFYSRFRWNKMPVIAMTSYGVAYMTGYTDRDYLCFTVLPGGTNGTEAPMKLISYSSSDGWQLIGEVGGDSNTVVFDEDNVTSDAVAAAVNAGKAVHLWKTDGDGNKVLMTLVRPPLADNSMTNYCFASAICPENAGDDLTVYTSLLGQDNSLTFKADVCTTTDYIGWVVETLEANFRENIIAASNEVKLAAIIFSDNKLYLVDMSAETQTELTFGVLTQLVTTRPTIVLDITNDTVYTFDKAGEDSASIVFSRTDGNTASTITMAADNTVTVEEHEITYTKTEIDTALGAYIGDVDTLLGESDGTTSGRTLVPAVTAEDEGKVLSVADGAAVWQGEDKYELIEDITLEEDANIKLTVQLKKLIMQMTFIPGTELKYTSAAIYDNAGGLLLSTYMPCKVAGGVSYGTIAIDTTENSIKSMSNGSNLHGFAYTGNYTKMAVMPNHSERYITTIHITNNILAGDNIKVYGVRA